MRQRGLPLRRLAGLRRGAGTGPSPQVGATSSGQAVLLPTAGRWVLPARRRAWPQAQPIGSPRPQHAKAARRAVRARRAGAGRSVVVGCPGGRLALLLLLLMRWRSSTGHALAGAELAQVHGHELLRLAVLVQLEQRGLVGAGQGLPRHVTLLVLHVLIISDRRAPVPHVLRPRHPRRSPWRGRRGAPVGAPAGGASDAAHARVRARIVGVGGGRT
jgi:hypothetical protein